MKVKRPMIFIAGLVLVLMQLACTIFVGGPAYPPSRIAVSTEAVASLNQQIQAAQTEASQSGVLTLTINETQITSLLAINLDSVSDPFIQNPQVYLRNGEIQVYGTATRGNLQANVRIVMSASINPDGKQVITVSSADFGPYPAPQGLNDTISALIDQALTGALGPAAIGLRLKSVHIADGSMTLTGQIK